MRVTLRAAAAGLALFLVSASPLRAGVYSTSEPSLYPLPPTFWEFQSKLGDIRGIPSPQQTGMQTLRDRYLAQVAGLEAKARAGDLTVQDRVNLGAYYIRLMKYEEAVQTLGPAETQDPDNWTVLANLAMANHLAGRLDRAIVYQQQALKNWPAAWVGFFWEQLSWYRQAEELYLKLLQARQQEERLQPGRPVETVDALFPELRFVGPSGRYQVGPLPDEVLGDKHVSRIQLVSQLVWWLPFDDRLYWLLAELLNAQGGVIEIVSPMMNDLVSNRRFDTPELRRHRQVINAVAEEWIGKQALQARQTLSWELAPRQPGTGLGLSLNEAGYLGVLAYLKKQAENPDLALASQSAAPEPQATIPPKLATATWLPDGRTFLVGLACGAALTLLVVQQFRLSRRRAEQGAGARKGG
jgi:tetratricopeptide (TPR) repeat protein